MSGARGEAFIEFEGEQLPILFTNRALGDVEKATSKTMLQIVNEAQNMMLGLTDTAHLLRAGLEYGRRDARVTRKPYTLLGAWDVMDEVGWIPTLELLVVPLAEVLGYKRQEDADDPPT